MKILLSAEQLETKAKLIANGEARVAAKTEKMSAWQEKQEADLTRQYQKAMAKLEKQKELVKERKMKQVLALKAKYSMQDEIAYTEFLFEVQNAKILRTNKLKLKQLEAKNEQDEIATIKANETAMIEQNNALSASAVEKVKAKWSGMSEVKSNNYQSNRNNEIAVYLKDWASKKFADLENKQKLLEENYNLGIEDIRNGAKSTIEHEEKTKIGVVNQKYNKLNYKLNAKTQFQELKVKDELNKKTKVEVLRNLYEDSDKTYAPAIIKTQDFMDSVKVRFQTSWLNFLKKWTNCRQWTFKDWVTVRIWTIPLYMYVILLGIAVAAICTGVAETKMMYPMFILFAISIIGGVVFSRIPIWNKFLGGAVMGCMFIGSFLVYFDAIPKDGQVYESIKTWFSSQDFLGMYISVIMICAIILVPRKVLVRAFGGFIIVIAIGSVAAFGLGTVGGLIIGTSPRDTIIYYALPTLGGGNGAGVQPMGDIAQSNGYDRTAWVSHALAITVIANIFSILFAAILSGVGKSKPTWSGDGQLMRKDIHVVEAKPKIQDRNITGAIVLVFGVYVLSTIISNQLLTKDVIKINLPNYAWMIVICLFINIFNIVPSDMKVGLEKIQKFFSKQTTWLVMLAIGITSIDMKVFLSALTGETFFIVLLICVGAMVVPLLIAKLFRFNPIEASIGAGLCMTAQGGAGVIAVLGASNRTELMPYGQITTRIGGSVVLILASVAFSAFAPNASEMATAAQSILG